MTGQDPGVSRGRRTSVSPSRLTEPSQRPPRMPSTRTRASRAKPTPSRAAKSQPTAVPAPGAGLEGLPSSAALELGGEVGFSVLVTGRREIRFCGCARFTQTRAVSAVIAAASRDLIRSQVYARSIPR